MTVSLAGGVRHPKIYTYTTPENARLAWKGRRKGRGLVKVGYTDLDAHVRIRQQLVNIKMPVDTPYDLLLAESAVTNDGRVFDDHAVHRML